MAVIQVYKNNTTQSPLGKGDGTLDKKNKTATIDTWTDKAAVSVGSEYALKSGGTFYNNANCTATGTNPVAQFNNFS